MNGTDEGSRAALVGVGRGSLVNLVGAGAAAVANLLLAVLLARSLGTTDVGAFFSATSLFLLLSTLGQLGTNSGVVYFLARLSPAVRRSTAPGLLRTAAVPVVVVAVVTGLVLVVAAGPLADLIGGGDQAHDALVVLGVATPLAAVVNLYTSASRGLGSMRSTAVLDQLVRPLLQLALVAVAALRDEVGLVVLAWAVPYLPTAIAAVLWWRRDLGRESAGADAEPVATRDFWGFTAPRALAGVAQLAMQRLDIVLVAGIAGLRDAAIYTAATRFLVVGQLAGTAIARAVQPRLAAAMARDDLATSGTLYRTGTAWQVVLAWPLYLVLATCAGLVLRLFGPTYVEGADVVVILSLVMLVATGCGMVDVVLTMAGRAGWSLVNQLVAFALNLGLDLLLIPSYGITGAAVGWAVAILAANLLPLVQVRRQVHLDPFGRSTLIAMGLSAAAFGVLPGVVRLVTGNDLATVLAVVVGLLVYAAGLWRERETLGLPALLAGFGTR